MKIQSMLKVLNHINHDLVCKDTKQPVITITWVPTIPECSLAMNIALCLRTKLFRDLSVKNSKIKIIGKIYLEKSNQFKMASTL